MQLQTYDLELAHPHFTTMTPGAIDDICTHWRKHDHLLHNYCSFPTHPYHTPAPNTVVLHHHTRQPCFITLHRLLTTELPPLSMQFHIAAAGLLKQEELLAFTHTHPDQNQYPSSSPYYPPPTPLPTIQPKNYCIMLRSQYLVLHTQQEVHTYLKLILHSHPAGTWGANKRHAW